MRLPYAELILAGAAAGLSVATLLMFSDIGFNAHYFQHVVITRWKFFALFAMLFAIGGWWTVRTWRQLWRCGRSDWEQLVFDRGVRGFGLQTGISLIAIIAWAGWREDSDGMFGPMMTGGALAGLFFGVPVALHMGYFWGMNVARVIGVSRDPRVETGEPPHLS